MLAKTLTRVVFAAVVSLTMASTSSAVLINIEYGSGTLFYSGIDATARAAIDAAAADVSAAITSSLNAISTDVYTGVNASTTVNFDWNYSYTNPNTGGLTTIQSPTIAADTITLFAGARSLLGSTLGTGGPSGIGFSLGASGFPGESPQAVTSAATQSEAALSRGGGPVIGSLGGDFDFSGTVTNYSIDYGIAFGSLSLDNDSDNNGLIDSSTALDNYWHWDSTTPVASGKNDLYSVALHEILHAIGIGTADSWDTLANGTTWNGSNVQAIAGSGSNLINPDGSHVANSVMSTRISDGMAQEVVMDPSITTGTRKELTVLDLAFLRDIGYETIIPTFPNPPDYDGDGDVDADDLATLLGAFGINGNGDADGDADTDGADFLVWQLQVTGPLPSRIATNVPEPASVWLLVVGAAMIGRRRG